MKHICNDIAKAIFRRHATRVARDLINDNPHVFNVVWGNAEQFAERVSHLDTLKRWSTLEFYIKCNAMKLYGVTIKQYSETSVVGFAMQRFLRFADWQAITRDITSSAIKYVDIMQSPDNDLLKRLFAPDANATKNDA